MPSGPLVRIVDATLGGDAQIRVVLSRVSDPNSLRSAWSSSGATIDMVGDRLHAVTTVEALARAAGRSLAPPEATALDKSLREATAAWVGANPPLKARGRELITDLRPLVMGVVNVTPDSFSDGGRLYPEGHPERAIAAGRAMITAGADVIDVGGESTRPGADEIEVDAELERVIPVVEALVGEGACVSIDTRKPDVAEAALAQGAAIVNDVSGAFEPDLISLAARTGAVYVLMHTRGTPADMATLTDYDDVVADVYEFLADGITRCEEAGFSPRQVVVDPGIGFAKTATQSLALLRATRQLRGLGRPVLIGASRKSFLSSVGEDDTSARVPGSLAAAALATFAGAALLRVHDVEATIATVRTARAIATGDTDWPTMTR